MGLSDKTKKTTTQKQCLLEQKPNITLRSISTPTMIPDTMKLCAKASNPLA